MRDVVSAGNLTWRHTYVLSVIAPDGTACHAAPVRYCTSKSRKP